MQKKLKIIPLGGVEEIGINCTVIEYGDQIIVIDVGLGFPLSDQYGVDYVIPNIKYLKKNKHKIEGIIITHAHLDHIGGLPYVLEDLDFPEVYASRFSIEMINNKLKEHNLLTKTNIKEVSSDSHLISGEFELNFFRVNHSIPESMGVIVKTPMGNIVHTGDFKFDNSPVNEPVTDYAKIAAAGAEGVLALISDSTNSFKKGHSKSEGSIGEALEKIVKEAKGRVVVATFSSLVNRLYQLIKIAEKHDRKVAIVGRSMENTIKIAKKLGYIDVPDSIFINRNKIKSIKDEKLLVLSTGAQGEDMAALARMARDNHPNISIKKGDSVILSASVIPGNDMLVQMLIDDLSLKGAYVFHNKDYMDLHSGGHGHQEDQKLMINLVKPKFFMPVHGYQSFLIKHGQTAETVGIEEKNIIISKRGSVIAFTKDKWQKEPSVPANPVLVSGSGVGDIGSLVLNDRQQLANYGMVVLVINLDLATKKIKGEPEVLTRGFVFAKENKVLISRIKDTAVQTVKNTVVQKENVNELKEEISKRLRKLLYEETQREPMILISINTD